MVDTKVERRKCKKHGWGEHRKYLNSWNTKQNGEEVPYYQFRCMKCKRRE